MILTFLLCMLFLLRIVRYFLLYYFFSHTSIAKIIFVERDMMFGFQTNWVSV